MNLTEICIIKRDGKRENFSPSKITNAISKAFNATGLAHQEELIDEITQRVIAHLKIRPSVWKKFRISWKRN